MTFHTVRHRGQRDPARRRPHAAHAGVLDLDESIQAAQAPRLPLGRLGYPEEQAQAAVWLGSDRVSFVNRHDMLVDAGMFASIPDLLPPDDVTPLIPTDRPVQRTITIGEG